MYKKKATKYGSIENNNSYDGERLEVKIEKVTNAKEPIDASAPIIYTEKRDGVMAGYNVRTDRFEIALETMDKIHRANFAKSEGKASENVAENPIGDVTRTSEKGDDTQVA